MTIIASPQQQVKDISTFADIASVFLEAIKNPKLIDQIKSAMIEAEAISDEKRQEASDAAITITNSIQITSEAKKALADVEIARGFANSENAAQKAEIQKVSLELENSRASHKAMVDSEMAAIGKLKDEASLVKNEAEKRHAEADARKLDLDIRESNLNAGMAKLAEREVAIAKSEVALKSEWEKLAERKKKLVAAAMEGDA